MFIFAFVLLFQSTSFSVALYEGPNGEIFIGDGLPQELKEKGYVPKTKKAETDTYKAKEETWEDYAGSENTLRMMLPEKNWALELPAPGFKITNLAYSPEGTDGVLYAGNKDLGMIISLFLEKSPMKGDSRDCRKYYLGKWEKVKEMPFKREEIKMSERGQIAIVEYLVREAKGMKINHKHMNAFLVKDDIWIDVHISKVLYSPDDERLFDSILDSIRINDKYTPNAAAYFMFGTSFYTNKNFKKAVNYFRKALDSMNMEPNPDRNMWIITVDNLGLSYAMAGDIKKAKETFEYGLSKESKYPMFYYNLACAYAASGDINNVILNLRKAFQYKSNLFPGQNIPDPQKDTSFQPYFKNEKFVKLMAELKR